MTDTKGMKDQSAQAVQAMQDVMEAMVRFSSAMAMFGVQQLKNTAEIAMDPQNGAAKLQKNLDQITQLMEGTLDENNKATSQKIAGAGEELISSIRMPAFDPGEVAHTLIEAMRNGIDSFTELVKKTATSVAEAAKDSGEGVTAGAAGGSAAVGEPRTKAA